MTRMPYIRVGHDLILAFRRQVGSWRAGLTLILMCSMLPAHGSNPLPLPDELTAEPAAWRRLGGGEMRWLGLRIYEASLWAPQASWRDDAPFALAIRYERAIPSSRLVQTSLDEMRRLGMADESRLEAWRAVLERAFPDVGRGDVIVGVNLPGAGVAFYLGDEPTGRITDESFARAFFAIWLDERTREPGLRTRLLGASGGG